MKKTILISIVFILILSLCNFTNAYSTSQYSIDIPSTWTKTAENVFSKSNGDGVNVQITPFTGNAGNPYTQEMLDKLVNEIYNNIDDYREEMKASLKQTYGLYMTDSEINKYVQSFKCNSIDLKEITTCSKNNYKCFHIISNFTMTNYSYYAEQYSIASGNNVFTLTLSSSNKSGLGTSEMKDIVNSFTINNYKEPSGMPLSPTLMGIIAGACAGAVAGIITYFRNKKIKNNNNGNV